HGAHVCGGLRARTQVGIADDFDEWGARSIQIHDRLPAAPVHVLPGVFFQMNAGDAHRLPLSVDVYVEPAAGGERRVVLADLIALGQVRIEVLLAGELAYSVDIAAQSQSRAHRQLRGPRVHDGQRARPSETHGTNVAVWKAAKCDGTAAEKLGARQQLRVDF